MAIVMVIVSSHVRDGTASKVDMNLYTFNNGSFVSLMPKSILIPSRTWYATGPGIGIQLSSGGPLGSNPPPTLSEAAVHWP